MIIKKMLIFFNHKEKENSDQYINSSLYWDLKYNNLL